MGRVKFEIEAETSLGDELVVVGSAKALGKWDANKGVRLQTTGEHYPLWWSDSVEFNGEKLVEFKFAKARGGDWSDLEWEADGREVNRTFAAPQKQSCCVVHGIKFNEVSEAPFGFDCSEAEVSMNAPVAFPTTLSPSDALRTGPVRVCIIGDSIAAGWYSWNLHGWAQILGSELEGQWGHQIINLAEPGLNIEDASARFMEQVSPHMPDFVVISFGIHGLGLYDVKPHARMRVQWRYMRAIKSLVERSREIGAQPVVTGMLPNGESTEDTQWFLSSTQSELEGLGATVIDWLSSVVGKEGRWGTGMSSDAAHPSTEGHKLMYKAIYTGLFRDRIDPGKIGGYSGPQTVFSDAGGFQVQIDSIRHALVFVNNTPYEYEVGPGWGNLQEAFKKHAASHSLPRGLYVDGNARPGPVAAITEARELVVTGKIAPGAHFELCSLRYSSMGAGDVVFYDGNLAVIKREDGSVCVANETTIEYNVHPMWAEVRDAMRGLDEGVYVDPADPEADFRTVIVGAGGLYSRFKVAPFSCTVFRWMSDLASYRRVALVPLGHRCALRMILHRVQYDGPCYPFDLTRTTSLADVADILATDFHDMWNPEHLYYSHEGGRLFHRKWTGLSFAHEVDEGDDPVNNIGPVLGRMKSRYGKRAARFRFVMDEADEVFLLRTGTSNAGEVEDMMRKVQERWPAAKATLFLFSAQPSSEFEGIEGVRHFDMDLNPDRMNEDEGYLEHCSRTVQALLQEAGVSSRNLFWCPASPSKLYSRKGKAPAPRHSQGPSDPEVDGVLQTLQSLMENSPSPATTTAPKPTKQTAPNGLQGKAAGMLRTLRVSHRTGA